MRQIHKRKVFRMYELITTCHIPCENICFFAGRASRALKVYFSAGRASRAPRVSFSGDLKGYQNGSKTGPKMGPGLAGKWLRNVYRVTFWAIRLSRAGLGLGPKTGPKGMPKGGPFWFPFWSTFWSGFRSTSADFGPTPDPVQPAWPAG